MQEDRPFTPIVAAAVLAVLGVVLLFSVVGSARGISAAGPGVFLFTAFHWASLFVPAYLLISACLLLIRPFHRSRLLMLTLSVVPFLTLASILKTLFESEITASPMTRIILTVFGRASGTLVQTVVLAIEIVIISRLRAHLDRPVQPQSPEESRRVFHPNLEQKVAARPKRKKDAHHKDEPIWVEPAQEVVEHSLVPVAAINGNEIQGEVEVLQEQPLPEESLPEEILPEESLPVPVSPNRSFENYEIPVAKILKEWSSEDAGKIDQETREAGAALMSTLAEFKIEAELTGIRKGPVITMFEILPSPGVKLSRVVNLADNIAMRLAASRIRIVAPIPGKHAVGIEVPNRHRSVVGFKEIVSLELFQDSHFEIPVVLGKNISGEAQIVDLVHTPHLLIAGATGSGKSVCVNAIIGSILYRANPNQVKLMLIDPKIVELKLYNDIPHLLTPVITDTKRAFRALNYCLYEMERRYTLLDTFGVRDIRSYNRKIEAERIATTIMPYIVIVVDEFADLMATSGKEMEAVIARLAAMSRAVGIHLVLATQRPSVDVITGLIKANIPSRIAFMVASKFDSRIIIDLVGAEKLLGQGDMLFTSAWDPFPMRIQGAFMAEEEAEALADHVKTLGEPDYIDEALFLDDEEEDTPESGVDDPLMDQAIEIVVMAGKASASYLQRRLKVGYNRAARLVEAMEAQGIVGPPNGSKPREILHVPDLRLRG